MNRHDLAVESNLYLSRLYTTAGMYIEAKNILLVINRQQLPKTLLPLYYETHSDFYGYYWQSNNQAINLQLHTAYRDSLLTALDAASLPYKIHNATKLVHNWQLEESKQQLSALFLQAPEGSADYALISYLLGLYTPGKTTSNNNAHTLPFRPLPTSGTLAPPSSTSIRSTSERLIESQFTVVWP